MKNIILNADKGLTTKFDASRVKFKKTFKAAAKLGVDLNNSTIMFKGKFADGRKGIFKICFVCGNHSAALGGRYFESITVLPYIALQK